MDALRRQISSLLAAGQDQAALARCVAAVAEAPDEAPRLALLAELQARVGQAAAARASLERAHALAPDDRTTLFNLGVARLNAGRAGGAAALLTRLLEATPGDAEAWLNLGVAETQLGRWPSALAAFQRAVALSPGLAEGWINRATAAATLAQDREAAAAFDQALALEPLRADWWARAGWFSLTFGAPEAARERFARARALAPDLASAVAGEATLLDREGQVEAALKVLSPVLDQAVREPRLATTFATLARRLGQPEAALGLVVQARRRVRGPHPELDQALGTLHDALGQPATAFAAWTRANEARGLHFDAAAWDDRVARIRATYTAAVLPRPARPPPPGPVLIVGLPRSGTSLVEQILSAHPQVRGGGELHALMHAAGSLDPHWPEAALAADADWLARVREAWWAEAGGPAPRATDKMPLNDAYLGLAAQALPGARVVWCLRDVRDVALSCYAQPFVGPHYAFSLSLEGLAHTIAGHHRLLAHWRRVLPLPLHLLRYEDLVADPEPRVRALLAFLDLPFAPACLRPEANQRRQNTASYAQIQEPIHTRAVARWRAYAEPLAPLLAALGPLAEPEAWTTAALDRA